MKTTLHWLVALAMLMICFVPAHMGLQFTDYAAFLSLTGICAVATLSALRFMQRVMPLDNTNTTKKKDVQ